MQNTSSSNTDASWRAELRGLPTEEYIKTCTRASVIDYRGYLNFISKDDTFTKSQAHSDWKITTDRLLQCKHKGLFQMGEGLQRKWNKNIYKYIDDMHWALMKRKRTAKLQSVKITGLVDASVNNTMKQMLQDESDLAPKATPSLASLTTSSKRPNPIASSSRTKPTSTTIPSIPHIIYDDVDDDDVEESDRDCDEDQNKSDESEDENPTLTHSSQTLKKDFQVLDSHLSNHPTRIKAQGEGQGPGSVFSSSKGTTANEEREPKPFSEVEQSGSEENEVWESKRHQDTQAEKELRRRVKVLKRDLGVALEEWATSLEDGSSERTLIARQKDEIKSLRADNVALDSVVIQLREESGILLVKISKLQNQLYQQLEELNLLKKEQGTKIPKERGSKKERKREPKKESKKEV
ncbi:hypothetical protein BGX27_007492, partial [Mortierella sp. AM989]